MQASADQQRPRLIELVDFDRAEGGSFSLMLGAVLQAARGRGWAVDLCVFDADHARPWLPEIEAAGVEVHEVPKRMRPRHRAQSAWIGGLLEASPEPTVLHTHFTSWDVGAALASRARSTPTGVFWHVHSSLPRSPLVTARTAVKFASLGRIVDAILCPAPNIADGVRRRMAPASKVRFIPSMLDTTHLSPATPDQRDAARLELGLPADRPILLHFGWHPYLKGSDIFVRTLAELRDHHGIEAHGVIRGGGERLAREVESAGLVRQVHVQGPVENIGDLFAASDLLVSSSRSEGMAYTVLEALATGTRVVATDIPGHAIIGKHVAACTITRPEPGALAAAIRDALAADPALAAVQRRDGRRWVQENLSLSRVSEWLVDIFASSVGVPGTGAQPPPFMHDFAAPEASSQLSGSSA